MEVDGYITTTIVVIFLCVIVLKAINRSLTGKVLPKIAGTSIPELDDGIDISKYYDIVYNSGTSFSSSHCVERLLAVRIEGYIGNESDEGASKLYMHGRWLVVVGKDGRRTYLMPHSIVSLQEAANG